ncbi:MAG: hypothetical protein H0T61_01080 [Actinobacteria bacterium]|nr:hypothetical protein [Actinomycetota bacterium]
MRQKHPNKLVAEYLNRLESAAAGLGRGRRTELVAEIREHVDDGLREAGAVDEVAVRNVLERLGPPEEIAAAAGPPPTRAGRLELAAMITLALPFVGWIIGVVLVAASRAWTGREKVVGIAIALLPAVILALSFVAVGPSSGADTPGGTAVATLPEEEVDGSSGGLGPIELVVVLGSFFAGPVAAVYLSSRLRRPPERTGLASA